MLSFRISVFGLCACVALAACTGSNTNQNAASGPDTNAFAQSAQNADDWILPGRTYENNRYTPMTDITPSNVSQLKKAWVTPLRDDGEQEASPVIWHGTIYVATPHDNVVALDAKTGTVKWAVPYNPQYVLAYAVNRGVGIADGKIFFGTQDCHIIALDATDGHQVWNVNGCPETNDDWYSMAAYVYKDQIIMGTAGGDQGTLGQVAGFSTKDGSQQWVFHTVPKPGEPNFGTWPGNSWQHGGAAVWAGLAVDPKTDTLYIAPGNAGPNLTLYGRAGKDLYSDSVVALTIAKNKPTLKWYYQILQNDTHDADPAMPPVLFSGKVKGSTRDLLAVGDKAGNFVVLDRTNGKQVFRQTVSKQLNLDKPPTPQGEFACPNHGGGIEWNGGAYDPTTNYFLVPSTQECAVWKVVTTGPVPYIPGQPYTAGPLPKRRPATGELTAIDINSGKVAWQKPLPYAGEAGVLVTATGIAFTTDLRGRIYAYDVHNGKELWHDDIGSTVVAPLSAYRIDGAPYLVTIGGEGGNQQTPNLPKSQGSRVVAYALNVQQTAMNDAGNQPTPPPMPTGKTESGQTTGTTGTLPYTPQQVQTGKTLYKQYCSSCHGTNLQGISAPALTGAPMARAKLNASQMRTIVTTQMPLNAPGSLKPDQYASIMAFLAAYDCVAPTGSGKTPFPTTDQPQFKQVQIGGATCPK